jgi:predicted dehydrogenase
MPMIGFTGVVGACHDHAVTLRFGLMGTGYWAAETHAAGLAGHPDVDFVGVWGRSVDKAQAVADRYGVRAYAEVNELIGAVDAVAFAVPPHVQAALATRAAQAGRHLLLDKPVALSTAAADRIVAALDRAGCASMVFTINRYFANVEAFLREAAATGGWHGARVTMCGAIFVPGNPYGASPWRREKGGLWDVGPHALSLLVPVLGPVTEVAAMAAPRDTYHLILRHRDAAVSTLALTVDAAPDATMGEIIFYGESGIATVPRGDADPVDAFRVAIGRLARNVADGVRDDPLDVHGGRDAVAVLAAAETAAREGGRVRLG